MKAAIVRAWHALDAWCEKYLSAYNPDQGGR